MFDFEFSSGWICDLCFSWNSITQTFLLSVRCSAKTIVKFGCFSSIVISTAVQCFVAIHKQRCLIICNFFYPLPLLYVIFFVKLGFHVLSCLLGHPPPSNFNDVIYGRPFGRGEGLECMQTAWYVLDIKMSDSLFPSSLSTPHCSAGVNRGISNSLGRNSCFITETVGGTVYRLDIRWLLFKICIHLFPDILVLGNRNMVHKIQVSERHYY